MDDGQASVGGRVKKEDSINRKRLYIADPLVYPRKLGTLGNLVRSDKATPIYPGPDLCKRCVGRAEARVAPSRVPPPPGAGFPSFSIRGDPVAAARRGGGSSLSGTTRNDTKAGGTIPRMAGGGVAKPIEGWRREPGFCLVGPRTGATLTGLVVRRGGTRSRIPGGQSGGQLPLPGV
jgi:hypothetical protein